MAGRASRSVGAVSVSGRRPLFPSYYLSSSVLACVWLSGSVPSVAPVVAAVGLSVAGCQWLAAALVPQLRRFALPKAHQCAEREATDRSRQVCAQAKASSLRSISLAPSLSSIASATEDGGRPGRLLLPRPIQECFLQSIQNLPVLQRIHRMGSFRTPFKTCQSLPRSNPLGCRNSPGESNARPANQRQTQQLFLHSTSPPFRNRRLRETHYSHPSHNSHSPRAPG